MITMQRFLMIKVVRADMFNYITIFFITFLSLNVLLVCEDPINAPLNKLEAEIQKVMPTTLLYLSVLPTAFNDSQQQQKNRI